MHRWRLSATDAAWLGGQAVLFLLAFVVVPGADGGPGRVEATWLRPVGWVVMALGAALAVWAMLALGPQLVPQPTPVSGGQVVSSGPYRVVRHPIYLGVLLLATGSMLRVASLTGLLVLLAAGAFLDRKAAHEERLLLRRHPDRYAELVRLVPWRVVAGLPAGRGTPAHEDRPGG